MDATQWIENRCLAYHYTKLGRQTYFGQWTPHKLRIHALNTTTPNLAGEPTLADGNPPNASWDIYYGMYLAAILDSSRKGGNFLLFLNN